MENGIRAALTALGVVFALVLVACGAGTTDNTDHAPPSAQELAIRVLAEQNQASLVHTDDLASSELLDGRTGAVTSLSEVVTGDRAVVFWYWVPN